MPHSRIHQLHKQFPPREFELWWPHTAASAEAVEARLNCSVLAEAAVTTRAGRHRGVIKILTWLASVPGDTWQARWLASGAENIRGSRYGATASWADLPVEWIAGHGRPVRHDRNDLAAGLLMLLCLDVIRPQLSWMLSRAHPFLAPMMAKLRDPDGFARLDELAATQAGYLARRCTNRSDQNRDPAGIQRRDCRRDHCRRLCGADRHDGAGALPPRSEEDRFLPATTCDGHLSRGRTTQHPRVRRSGRTADDRTTRRPLPDREPTDPRSAHRLSARASTRAGLHQPQLSCPRTCRAVLEPRRGHSPPVSTPCTCRLTSPAHGRTT